MWLTACRCHFLFDENQTTGKTEIYTEKRNVIVLTITRITKARKKNFGSGQLIFENWSSGPVDVFLWNRNLNFPNLTNANMQTWMPMQRWQAGGVRCWMSGAGQNRGVPGMEKAGCWRVKGPNKSP